LSVRIRLRRIGAKKKPFYRIVVADSRAARGGKFIEQIGYYDPTTAPPTMKVDEEKARIWLGRGAQPTDTARSLLRKAGVFEPAKPKEAAVPGAVSEPEEAPKAAQAPTPEPEEAPKPAPKRRIKRKAEPEETPGVPEAAAGAAVAPTSSAVPEAVESAEAASEAEPESAASAEAQAEETPPVE